MISQGDDVEMQWKQLKNIICQVSEDLLGYPKRKSPDWFRDNEESIQKLLNEKDVLFKKHLNVNSEKSKADFKVVKAKVQKEIRRLKDDWWSKLAEEMQGMADRNDTKGFFLR